MFYAFNFGNLPSYGCVVCGCSFALADFPFLHHQLLKVGLLVRRLPFYSRLPLDAQYSNHTRCSVVVDIGVFVLSGHSLGDCRFDGRGKKQPSRTKVFYTERVDAPSRYNTNESVPYRQQTISVFISRWQTLSWFVICDATLLSGLCGIVRREF